MNNNPIVVVAGNEPAHMQFRAMSDSAELMAIVRLRPMLECKTVGVVYGLETFPAYRRQGHGFAVVSAAEEYARKTELGILIATIWTDNLASRSLFQKAGFRALTTWKSLYSGHDLLLYAKELVKST